MKNTGLQEQNHFSKKEKILGQFFTPKEVVNFILEFILLNQDKRNKAVDPACGDGIFIKGLIEQGFEEIVGIDIDKEVVDSIPNEIKKRANILNKNGLLVESKNNFDVVVGNPPFSAKYGRIKNKNILSLFDLGKNKNSQAIEILFLEKFINLASPNGVIGIVLPYGIISNKNLGFVRDYLFKNTQILGIISLPRFIFNGGLSTSSKTFILFLKKQKIENRKIFMSIPNNLNELNEVLSLYTQKKEKGSLAFWSETKDNNLSPEFYNPRVREIEQKLENSSFEIKKLKSVIKDMFCGRTEYGKNRVFSERGIPFISAKVITNLGLDFERDKKFVSKGSCMFKKNALVKKDDFIFVRVGAGCAGRSAIIVNDKECGIVDDWCYVIRTNKELSPYFLSFYLNTKYGKIQIEKIKRGVGTTTIPQSLLKEILIPIFGNGNKFRNLYLKMREKYKAGKTKKAQEIFNNTIKIIENTLESKIIR